MAIDDELLVKLKKLDPETWMKFYRAERGYIGADQIYLDDKRVFDLLQGVVQEAIMSQPSGAGRQWIYHSRGRTAAGGPDYRALAGVLEVVDGAVVDRTHEAHGDTPAEALLRAYIATLEAEREAEKC